MNISLSSAIGRGFLHCFLLSQTRQSLLVPVSTCRCDGTIINVGGGLFQRMTARCRECLRRQCREKRCRQRYGMVVEREGTVWPFPFWCSHGTELNFFQSKSGDEGALSASLDAKRKLDDYLCNRNRCWTIDTSHPQQIPYWWHSRSLIIGVSKLAYVRIR